MENIILQKSLTKKEKSDTIIYNFVKGLSKMTMFSNRKMNNSCKDASMVASSVFAAKNSAATTREVENAIVSGTALAVSVLLFALINLIKLSVLCLALISLIIIVLSALYKVEKKQNVGLFMMG